MAVLVIALFLVGGYASAAKAQTATELSDEQLANLVRRSYQYVALYNVNNKMAELTRGWNQMLIDSKLKDHTLRVIARPNNDTLYITAMLDLRKDPVILEFPKFESKYVSLMVTGYDHYVNVPMTSRLGDFQKPEKVLFYTARTEGYAGEPVKGMDRVFEMTGDFVSAVLRVMPRATEPEKFKRIAGQMQSVKLLTLSEFRGGQAKPIDDIEFPPVGATDFDVFENNLLEVMQFVFNHTTFDLANEIDREVLAAYKPLGIQPGRQYDPSAVKTIDGKRFRRVAEQVAAGQGEARICEDRTEAFCYTGEAEIEIVTAKNSGKSASNQVKFYLLDEDDNVIGEVSREKSHQEGLLHRRDQGPLPRLARPAAVAGHRRS